MERLSHHSRTTIQYSILRRLVITLSEYYDEIYFIILIITQEEEFQYRFLPPLLLRLPLVPLGRG